MNLLNHNDDKYNRILEQVKLYSEKLKRNPKDKQARRDYAFALKEAKLAGIGITKN